MVRQFQKWYKDVCHAFHDERNPLVSGWRKYQTTGVGILGFICCVLRWTTAILHNSIYSSKHLESASHPRIPNINKYPLPYNFVCFSLFSLQNKSRFSSAAPTKPSFILFLQLRNDPNPISAPPDICLYFRLCKQDDIHSLCNLHSLLLLMRFRMNNLINSYAMNRLIFDSPP